MRLKFDRNLLELIKFWQKNHIYIFWVTNDNFWQQRALICKSVVSKIDILIWDYLWLFERRPKNLLANQRQTANINIFYYVFHSFTKNL